MHAVLPFLTLQDAFFLEGDAQKCLVKAQLRKNAKRTRDPRVARSLALHLQAVRRPISVSFPVFLNNDYIKKLEVYASHDHVESHIA